MSLPNEEWRPIEAHPGYFVSNRGNVWSTRRANARLMIPVRKKRHGYLSVNLKTGGPGSPTRTRTVHSLVAEAFLGPRPAGLLVLHNDGNQLNNAVSNLRYGTYAENWQDAFDHGYRPAPVAKSARVRATHCCRGHAFDGVRPSGKQACSQCERIRQAQRPSRRKGAVTATA